MSYISVEEFKDLPLGVSLKNMSNDTLQYILDVATGNVEQFTERVFSSAYYEEVVVGNDSDTLTLWNYPVIDYISLKQTVFGPSGGDTEMDVNSLVRTTTFDSAGLMVLSGYDSSNITTFSSGNTYTIQYRAGFETIPPTVKHATALWATELLQPDYSGPNQQAMELIPASSEQISELLTIWKRRRI
jgi:hypothetical protein